MKIFVYNVYFWCTRVAHPLWLMHTSNTWHYNANARHIYWKLKNRGQFLFKYSMKLQVKRRHIFTISRKSNYNEKVHTHHTDGTEEFSTFFPLYQCQCFLSACRKVSSWMRCWNLSITSIQWQIISSGNARVTNDAISRTWHCITNYIEFPISNGSIALLNSEIEHCAWHQIFSLTCDVIHWAYKTCQVRYYAEHMSLKIICHKFFIWCHKNN